MPYDEEIHVALMGGHENKRVLAIAVEDTLREGRDKHEIKGEEQLRRNRRIQIEKQHHIKCQERERENEIEAAGAHLHSDEVNDDGIVEVAVELAEEPCT
jgi:hypothetical protein